LDHDHVLADLRDRFDMVLEALEHDPEWVTNRVTPGRIVLGELGGIETGVRQLIRRHRLEVEEIALPSGRTVRVPTEAETIRIKAYLAVKRNQVRDYLDIAALSAHMGVEAAAAVLVGIDEFYADDSKPGSETVASQVLRQLANPTPKDARTIRDLASYKGVKEPWDRWDAVVRQCQAVAATALWGEEG
jgi:hypothetical protein